MASYSFTVTEHDEAKPWIVCGVGRHTTDLDETVDFFAWAREQWPPERYSIELDPWQLGPARRQS